MKTSSIIAIVAAMLVGSILVSITAYVMFDVSYSDKAVTYEENIRKLDMSSESLLSNGTMTILDKASIQRSYANDFKESLRISIASRSANEQGLAMKWVQENNPKLGSEMYRDISSYIEGMRRDFHLSRDRLMDQCSAYKIARRKAWSGFWMSEFPTEEFERENRCKVITDQQTSESFSTGVQKAIL